jgi:hypothetical protein
MFVRDSRLALLTVLLAAMTTLEGCAAIEGIFKAGVGVGVFLAIVAVVVVLMIARGLRA